MRYLIACGLSVLLWSGLASAEGLCGCTAPCEHCLPDSRDMNHPVVTVEPEPIPTDYWKPCSEIESDLKNCRSWVGCGSAYPIGVEWARKIPATVHWMASFPGKVSEVDPCPAVGYKWTIQTDRCGFVCARSDEEAEGFLEQAH